MPVVTPDDFVVAFVARLFGEDTDVLTGLDVLDVEVEVVLIGSLDLLEGEVLILVSGIGIGPPEDGILEDGHVLDLALTLDERSLVGQFVGHTGFGQDEGELAAIGIDHSLLEGDGSLDEFFVGGILVVQHGLGLREFFLQGIDGREVTLVEAGIDTRDIAHGLAALSVGDGAGEVGTGVGHTGDDDLGRHVGDTGVVEDNLHGEAELLEVGRHGDFEGVVARLVVLRAPA